MDCSELDLKGYFLGESRDEDRRAAAAHLKTCARCQEEAERLRATHSALMMLPDEEPPRRIAFVSDAVFEPRWWHRLWHSAPQLGFLSASVLAAAILVHAFARPAPVVQQAAIDSKVVEARVEAEVGKRVQTIVAQAVSESEARQAQRSGELIQAAERRIDTQRRGDFVAVQDYVRDTDKKLTRLYRDISMRASADPGGSR